LPPLLFDFLFHVEMEGGGHPVAVPNPAMVETVRKSNDQLTWHITLQPDLRWHDGQPD